MNHPERPDPRTQTASAAAICIRNAAAAACSGVQSACPVLKAALGKEKLVSTSEETKGIFKLTLRNSKVSSNISVGYTPSEKLWHWCRVDEARVRAAWNRGKVRLCRLRPATTLQFVLLQSDFDSRSLKFHLCKVVIKP